MIHIVFCPGKKEKNRDAKQCPFLFRFIFLFGQKLSYIFMKQAKYFFFYRKSIPVFSGIKSEILV